MWEWILGCGRSPGGRHGNPFQYSCLGNTMDRGAWFTKVQQDLVNKQQRSKLARGSVFGL